MAERYSIIGYQRSVMYLNGWEMQYHWPPKDQSCTWMAERCSIIGHSKISCILQWQLSVIQCYCLPGNQSYTQMTSQRQYCWSFEDQSCIWQARDAISLIAKEIVSVNQFCLLNDPQFWWKLIFQANGIKSSIVIGFQETIQLRTFIQDQKEAEEIM